MIEVASKREHLVTVAKLQRTPGWNAAFMRQIWARRRLLPDESGVPVAVARCTPSKMTAEV